MTRRLCGSTDTASGNPCRRTAPPGQLRCSKHTDTEEAIRARTKAAYIEAMAETLTPALACARAGISYRQVRYWLVEDAEFAVAYQDAIDQAVDRVESSMYARAVGVDVVEVTTHTDPDGRTTTTRRVRREADTRAGEVLLRGYRPKFRTNYVEPDAPSDLSEADETLRRILADERAAELFAQALDQVGL